MLFTYLIKRTDLKKSFYVIKSSNFVLLYIHALLAFSFNDN